MYCPPLEATNCFIFKIGIGLPRFSIFNFTSRQSNENYLECKSVVCVGHIYILVKQAIVTHSLHDLRLPQLLGDCNVESRSETALTHGEAHAHARK